MNFIRSRATSSLPRAPPLFESAPVSGVPAMGAPVSAICDRFLRVLQATACVTTLGYCIFFPMPLTAVRHVRKMRGGAQAHLLEADDGHWYVVKFRNNPQHRRILVNESLAATFLEYLKIATPKTALIEVTAEFLTAHPDVHLHLGTRRIPFEPGWQFGSIPGRPRPHRRLRFSPRCPLAPGSQPG